MRSCCWRHILSFRIVERLDRLGRRFSGSLFDVIGVCVCCFCCGNGSFFVFVLNFLDMKRIDVGAGSDVGVESAAVDKSFELDG